MAMYFIGKNTYGEFGWGYLDSIPQLTKHKKNITNIMTGYGYNIFIDSDNNLWSAGWNQYGQCAVKNKTDWYIPALTPISYFKKNKIKIKKVCTSIGSESHVVFWITNENKLYSNGRDPTRSYSQYSKHRYMPKLEQNIGSVIIQAASTRGFSIALWSININAILSYFLRLNNIYIPIDIMNMLKIFYVKLYGRLSTVFYRDYPSNFQDKWKVVKELSNTHIVKIAAGNSHCLLVSYSGIVYKFDKYKIQKIIFYGDNDIKIKDIQCGDFHYMALSYDNKVYAWGYNDQGQCGDGSKTNYFRNPKQIHFFKDKLIKLIKCGTDHSYVCTMDNRHYLFGNNAYKQCIGFTKQSHIVTPYEINRDIDHLFNLKTIKSVNLGCKNTVIIFSDA